MPFFEELRRRQVVKEAFAYAIVALLLLQLAQIREMEADGELTAIPE